MADEHTRKFNYWHIVKPERKVCVPSSQAVVGSKQQPAPDETTQSHLSEESHDKLESNPFVETSKESSPEEFHSSHQSTTAPFVPELPQEDDSSAHQDENDSGLHESGETVIDPDTGLEIPEYMQPFINRNS